MKTNNKTKVELAEELLALITDRLNKLKREEELKLYFKNKIGAGKSLEAGNVLIFVEEKERATLNKEKLEAVLGAEKLALYLDRKKFTQVNVKQIGGAK